MQISIKNFTFTILDHANQCCVHHDNCYMTNPSQAECDQVFCSCLDKHMEHHCVGLSTTFCLAVQLFGHNAHRDTYRPTNRLVNGKVVTHEHVVDLHVDGNDEGHGHEHGEYIFDKVLKFEVL